MSGSPQIMARTQAMLPAVSRMIALGMSQGEMAHALKISKHVVNGICQRWLKDEWEARPNKRTGPNRGAAPRQAKARPVGRLGSLPPLPPVTPARDCQWPLEPWQRPWPVCGEPVGKTGCPYCAVHTSRAYAGVARRMVAE